MSVVDINNGFTERPLTIGKIETKKNEIESFAAFLAKNLIAIPYYEDGKIVFSLTSSMLKQSGLKLGYSDESWVSFNFEGNVTASISKKDYLRYKDSLSFDRLCSSLGNLFIEFYKLYINGEGLSIINRLNSLKLNPLFE